MVEIGVAERCILELCELPCCKDSISDLSIVHVLLTQIVDTVHDVLEINIRFLENSKAVNKVSPDFCDIG